MKTLILDMYGVIMKDPTANLLNFINNFFPKVTFEDIYPLWKEADTGKLTSLDFLKEIGFEKNTAEIEKMYLNTLEIDEEFYFMAQELKEDYNLVLLSNDLSDWSTYIRNKYDISKYFNLIAVSGDIGIRKPDPRIFKFVLEKSDQFHEECYFVDDRRSNLYAAEKLGINSILFNRRNVEYQGKTVYNFRELTELMKLISVGKSFS